MRNNNRNLRDYGVGKVLNSDIINPNINPNPNPNPQQTRRLAPGLNKSRRNPRGGKSKKFKRTRKKY